MTIMFLLAKLCNFPALCRSLPIALEGIDIITDPVLMIRGSTKKPRILTRDLYTLGGIKKYYFTFPVYVEADVEELKKVYVIEEETEEGSIKNHWKMAR